MPLNLPHNYEASVLDLFSLKGKIAAVVGGGRGIGLEISKAYAQAGADVAIVYCSTNEAHLRAEEISQEYGTRVQAFESDVRSRDTIAKTIEEITKSFGRGRLDIVVANAGVCASVNSLDYTEEQWAWNCSTNYDGVMWTAQACGRIFKKQGFGNLIVTASVSSVLCNTPQTQVAYNSSKAAAAHLTRCLAVEWADFARVNSVSPGYVNTRSRSNYYLQGTYSADQYFHSGRFTRPGTDGPMGEPDSRKAHRTALRA
jgi:sorbose reductase